jgi:hypothetical protein
VLWSVCHLFHQAAEGDHHWHEIGPEIMYDLPRIPYTLREQFREVIVNGNIHIQDFKIHTDPLWGHHTFNGSKYMDPNRPTAEIAVYKQTGDVTAELLIRMKLQSDNSIGINIKAYLYDEEERVASYESNPPNVLMNGMLVLSGASTIIIKDFHSGDPDQAIIYFTIENKEGN